MWQWIKPLLILVGWLGGSFSLGWHITSYKEQPGYGIVMFLLTMCCACFGAALRFLTYR